MKLEITNVSKSFGKRKVLDDLSFEMNTGEMIGLFGRNGSGKSTLLQLIFGTLQADQITIKVDEKLVSQKQIIPSKLVSYLPQHSFLPPLLTVRQVVPLYFTSPELLDRIFYTPTIAKFESRRIGTLSHGERKYLSLLLVSHLPNPFLLLDEPFAMIDPLFQERIKELLQEIRTDKGILVTDHYYKNVLDVATRSYLMTSGKMRPIQGAQELQKAGYLPSSFQE